MNYGEKQFRNRITWVQFLFCLLVIWVHSYNVDIFQPVKYAGFIKGLEYFLSDELGQIAVPGFFMVSAFLFYRKFHWKQLERKWKSRVHTLLLPYVVWNVLYYIAYLLMTNIPLLSRQLNRPKAGFGWKETLLAVFYYKYNSVFWFMFQLILLVVLAPAVYALLRDKIIGLAAMSIVFLCLMFRIDLPLLNMDALMYYLIGAYAALHGERLVTCAWNRKMAWVSGGLLFLSFGLHICSEWTQSVQLLLLYRMTFPVCLWFFMGSIRLPEAKEWMKHTFFVYATHFLVIRAFNKLGGLAFPGQPVWALIFYLISPLLVFVISGTAAALIGRYVPRLWQLLGGGRVQKNGA